MFKLFSPFLGIALALGLIIAMGFYISPRDDLRRVDSIVVVSGGDTTARTLEAVRLYEEGWAPTLIFSGAAQDPTSPSNASIMKSIAIGQGVPPDVIIVEGKSRTTHQNANEVAVILTALGHKRIILVTSPYHQRRANAEFQGRLGDGVQIIDHPAPDRVWSRRFWWASPVGWYLTLTEMPKIAFTLLSQQF